MLINNSACTKSSLGSKICTEDYSIENKRVNTFKLLFTVAQITLKNLLQSKYISSISKSHNSGQEPQP